MASLIPSLARNRDSLAHAERSLDLSGLRSPKREAERPSTERDPKPEPIPSPEKAPSHFAPENPINRELAKERWYTRAAWASLGIGYGSAMALILYGDPSYSSRSAVTGLFIDSMFSYFALKNSELRRFILEGKVLPNPAHSMATVGTLLAVGGVLQVLSAASSALLVGSLCMAANFSEALFRGSMALVSLHLGVAWLRRVAFFRSIDSQ
jgi:hypothetical protein